jgi:hypothetical protein
MSLDAGDGGGFDDGGMGSDAGGDDGGVSDDGGMGSDAGTDDGGSDAGCDGTLCPDNATCCGTGLFCCSGIQGVYICKAICNF